jgi:orotidine-5'-phosphate decarboxylase
MSARVGARAAPNAADRAPELRAGTYLARLGSRSERLGTVLCLGVDPHVDALPDGFPRNVDGIERFARLVVEAAGSYAVAVKFNVAFFEAHGSGGVAALERLRAAVPADLPVIADAKRGDIGSTAMFHAAAIFDSLGADAVTANPYLGADGLEPLLARSDRFVYVLCRTSNPGAHEFQALVVAGDTHGEDVSEPLYLRVARRARAWSETYATVGLVVGATAPDELRRVRAAAPELPFLVPGVGAQGGDPGDVLGSGVAAAGSAGRLRGGGLLVNVSRAIASAGKGARDPGAAIAQAAQEWSQQLRC